MTANLENIHEIYNIFCQKNRMNADIINFFDHFHLSQTLRHLKMEKQQGVSASLLIVLLCLFRMCHESIGSFYSHQFYGLFQSGKNCFYRMYNRSSTDWRKLLLRMSVRFMSILKEEGSGTWPLTHSLNALLNFWRSILGMRWSDVRLVVKKKRTSVYLLSVPTVTNRKASTEPGGTVEAWDG